MFRRDTYQYQYAFLWRLAIFFFLLSASCASAGCNSGQDTNETLYTSLIGIDKSDGGKIRVSYQFENLKKPDEDSDKASSTSGIKVITIEGGSFHQTIDFLTSIVSRTPSFAHVRAVVFGEELAREGIVEFLTVLLRFNEFRSNTYILVVNNGSAMDFIAKNKPTIESSASKYIETQMSLSKYANIFLKSNIHEFYNRLKSNSAAPYAALGGVNSETDNKDLADWDAKVDITNIHAGEIPRKGSVNPTEIAGTALFLQDRMIGKLNSRETLIVSIFKRDFRHCIIKIDDPYVPGSQIGVELRIGRHPDINVCFEGEKSETAETSEKKPKTQKPKISVKMDFICVLTNIPSGMPYEKEEYREELEKIISNYMLGEIKNMLAKTQKLGVDIIGFGYKARTQFRTYPEFMSVKWNELYAQSDIDVNVTSKIKNSGLMRQTSPMR